MPKWLDNAIFYEIYPQSFQDSNGDGIGDFQGIIKRLSYIKELGCNAIWMNPCFASPFMDAGYDVSDYYTAAPRYGTNEDLRQLFIEAHKLGMHLILDLVPGHTSIDCAWFQESIKPEKNIYTDRYIWTDSVWDTMDNITNITGCLRGISARDGSCATNFFSTQPALNYGFVKPDKPWQSAVDSPEAIATRQAIKDVMAFWLQMGCDGFRVDMAGSLVKGDTDGSANIELWQDIRTFLDQRFPEAVIISEWGQPDRALKGGFHMDFLLHFGPSHYMDLFRTEHPFFSKRGEGNIYAFAEKYLEYYQATAGKGFICIPSGNHDMPRIGGTLDAEEIKLAFAFLLSMPGVPFIYYGDEIGMQYQTGMTSVEGGYERTGSRTPMQWDDTANAGFSSASKEKLYIAIDENINRPTVEKQLHIRGSLLEEVKKLIAVRQSHSALQSNADFSFIHAAENSYPLLYQRTDNSERILIVLNPAGKKSQCTISLPEFAEIIYENGDSPVYEKGVLTVPPQSVAFIRLASH